MLLVSAQVHLNLPQLVDSASKLVMVLLVSVARHRTNPHPTRPALVSVLMLVSPAWVLALVSLMPASLVVLDPARTNHRPRTVLHPETSVVLLVLVMLSLLLTPITTVSCLAVNSMLPVIRLFDRILI